MGKLQSTIGPGLLMAAAAVGVSHLVQSTRAGANFGFELIPLILLINLLEYPFFEYGHRFYAVTEKTLLDGYLQMGRLFLGLFLVLNTITAMASVAGVTFVTGALLQSIFGISDNLSPLYCAATLLGCGLAFLGLGKYKALDRLIKALMVILVLTTFSAVIISLSFRTTRRSTTDTPYSLVHLAFLLLSWDGCRLPSSSRSAISLDESSLPPKPRSSFFKEALFDFRLGYFMTVILALGFCSLGALVMYGTGQTFDAGPSAFASQVVSLYTEALGSWSKLIIGVAAFVTMFSTTLTLIDAYPRSLAEGSSLFLGVFQNSRVWLLGWVALNCAIALVIIWFFRDHLKAMVDFVTILAFLAGPVFGYLN